MATMTKHTSDALMDMRISRQVGYRAMSANGTLPAGLCLMFRLALTLAGLDLGGQEVIPAGST